MCPRCAAPAGDDPGAFDGRAFCRGYRARLRRPAARALAPQRCAQAAAPDAGGAAGGRAQRRNVVAKGMRRFETGAEVPSQPPVERLSPRVVSVLGMNPSPFTLNGTNCYLVGTGERRVLIDAGESPAFGPQSRRQHVEFLDNLGAAMAEEGCTGLDMIVITHLHGDHFGGAFAVQERWGPAPIAMLPVAPWSTELYTMRELRERGLVETLRAGPAPVLPDGRYSHDVLVDAAGNVVGKDCLPPWPDEDLSWDRAGRTKAELQRDFWWCEKAESWYDRWAEGSDGSAPGLRLHHGQVIATEGATLRVMHTPGHAQNHATLVLDEEHSIFCGDHVLGFGTSVVEDMYSYVASLEAMRRYRPARLYPGHGPMVSDGAGLLDGYSQHRQSREDQIAAALQGRTLTAAQLVEELYPSTSGRQRRMARSNVEKILLKLGRGGQARCYTDASRSALEPMPSEGYVAPVGPDAAWELAEQAPSCRLRFEDLVASIASAGAEAAGSSGAAPVSRL